LNVNQLDIPAIGLDGRADQVDHRLHLVAKWSGWLGGGGSHSRES